MDLCSVCPTRACNGIWNVEAYEVGVAIAATSEYGVSVIEMIDTISQAGSITQCVFTSVQQCGLRASCADMRSSAHAHGNTRDGDRCGNKHERKRRTRHTHEHRVSSYGRCNDGTFF